MLTVEYLRERLRKNLFAMTNPSLTPGASKYLKMERVMIETKLEQFAEREKLPADVRA